MPTSELTTAGHVFIGELFAFMVGPPAFDKCIALRGKATQGKKGKRDPEQFACHGRVSAGSSRENLLIASFQNEL